MATATPAKPKRSKRETWKDWTPDGSSGAATGEWLTRDEVIEQLAQQGVIVSAFDIQNWQEGGVIPYGVRRWQRGAARAVYPPQMIDAVRRLRALQAAKRKLADIGPELRRQFARTVPASAAIAILPDPLAADLAAWARQHEATFGAPIERVVVTLEGKDRSELTFRIDPHQPANQPSLADAPTVEDMRVLRARQREEGGPAD